MKRMKRMISVILAMATVFNSCPIPASAVTVETIKESEENQLSYEEYLYTVLDDGTISICGYTGTPENATHYADREIYKHEITEGHIYLYIYKEVR